MADVSEEELVNEGALPPDDFHDHIERVIEVAPYEVLVPGDIGDQMAAAAKDLLIDPRILSEAAAALEVGHLVLEGPPGSGKSSLARALCRAYHCEVLPVTAHENWSTFEVIGRQELRVDAEGHEEIVPVNGFFAEAVIRCAGAIVRHFDDDNEPQATWLLIDELNRAHIDKAFGELFTALGTDEMVPITLSYQRVGNREIVTPRRFRIIATLNSFDRQFVNTLSQGLRRRFTFITVGIPPKRGAGEKWNDLNPASSLAIKEFHVVMLRAASRVARRDTPGEESAAGTKTKEYMDWLRGPAAEGMNWLFALVERVRYVKKGDPMPHLPIGTAQLIDTVELFLTRMRAGNFSPEWINSSIDWAASVKLAPLFDTDTVRPGDLEELASNLQAPFANAFKRQLQAIVGAGLYDVSD